MKEIYRKNGVKAGLSIEKRVSKIDKNTAEMLREVGQKMTPSFSKYLGSAAFHIYSDEVQGQILVLSQTPLGAVAEKLADLGIKELAKSCMAFFGRKVPGLRDETPWDSQEQG
jgi:Ni,Fe-hydrogenase I large subunit